MDSFSVCGGNPLVGNIDISGAKNAALPIMAAAVLTKDEVIIDNIPRLVDVYTMIQLLESHGVLCEWLSHNSLKICASSITNLRSHYDIVRKMRASIWMLGPLLARFGEAEVSMPGGCTIGARLVDQHIAVLQNLGSDIEVHNGYMCAKSNNHRLIGSTYVFTKVTVGGTINGILAATLAKGVTIFSNCAIEPEIVDLCHMLNKMGARISGVGTSNLMIDGVEELHGCRHRLIADRIEAATYIMTVGMTGGRLCLNNIDASEMMGNIIPLLRDCNIKIDLLEGSIVVESDGKVHARDVHTGPYPGFSTDYQGPYTALMTIASGVSTINEHVFENRFMHVPELCRMGANISIEGHTAIVRGVNKLYGSEVMCSDLRASAALIMAALVADGESKINRIYHLDRGYYELEEKLRKCGAVIKRIKSEVLVESGVVA